jgi:hypothetical protein
MVEVEILLAVTALCLIAYRLQQANQFLKDLVANLKELLASSRHGTVSLAVIRQHFAPERKTEREIKEEPLPPPLTLDDDDRKADQNTR